MPLLIELKANDKVIINGAVIENISNANTKLMLHSRASILREREILAAEDAVTPASRVYYDLQCAYVFKEHRQEHMQQFEKDLGDYVAACPSTEPVAQAIHELVAQDNFYKALKKSKELIVHEAEVFKQFHERLSELTRADENDGSGDEDNAGDA